MTIRRGIQRALRTSVAALLLGVALPCAAQAHPHVWIDAIVEAWFVQGAVTEFRVT